MRLVKFYDDMLDRVGAPQSQAGRFVLAAARALQPSEAWVREPDHWVAKRRACILYKGVLERDRGFADSLAERDGFELSVPGRETVKRLWETGLLSRT